MIIRRRNELKAREAGQTGSTSLIAFQIFFKNMYMLACIWLGIREAKPVQSMFSRERVDPVFVSSCWLHFALPLKRGLTWINSVIINSLILI